MKPGLPPFAALGTHKSHWRQTRCPRWPRTAGRCGVNSSKSLGSPSPSAAARRAMAGRCSCCDCCSFTCSLTSSHALLVLSESRARRSGKFWSTVTTATSGRRDGGRASPASATGPCLLAAPARPGQEVGWGPAGCCGVWRWAGGTGAGLSDVCVSPSPNGALPPFPSDFSSAVLFLQNSQK